MVSAKEVFGNVIGKLLFRTAEITVTDVGSTFRRVALHGEALRKVAWTAGDKVQVALHGMTMRTYTPTCWDPEQGTTELLVYMHGDAPGCVWARSLTTGAICQFFGPRRSLRARLGEPTVLFGDETSFGVALALQRAGHDIRSFFEVTSTAASEDVIRDIGITHAQCIAKAHDDNHLAQLYGALRAAAQTRPQLLLTGRAQSIQRIRRSLQSDAMRFSESTKAYWAVDKVGLD